jgi:5-formyltetrahydrofolate cyclo-ligase
MDDQARGTLRAALRARRRALAPAERVAAAEAIAVRLAALPFAPVHGHVAGYWAMDGEIALHAWQMRLPRGVTYCLPVLHADGHLRFAPWRPGDALTQNRFGIPEPDVDPALLLRGDALAMVVVPLVAFDPSGHRLGMGAGWYDRTFAGRIDAPAPPWLVGAAFAMQRVDDLVARNWDVPLDAACTERDTHLFNPDAPLRAGDPDEG